MYEVYLAHHGILGQKWGVRRYQNPDGSLTAAGKKRYTIDEDGKIRKLTGSERRAIEKSDKQRAAALEKARKARVEKAEYNKQKAEAIKSGDASKIEKYFNDLTPAEMQDAMNRINTKQNFQRMLNNEAQLVSNGKSKTDQLMDKVGKLSDYADKGIRMYNIIAKVNNAFNADSYMPQIGGEWAGDRKKKLEREAKEELKKAKEEAETKKKEKEKEEKDRVLRTGSEHDILAIKGKMDSKDWMSVSTRFSKEDELMKRMADKRIAELNAQKQYHEQEAERYKATAEKARAESERLRKKYANR